MKRVLATIFIAILSIGGIGCGGKKTTVHKIATYTGNVDAGVLAFVESTKVLRDAGRLSDSVTSANYNLAYKVTNANDIIRDRARTGWSKQDALTVLDELIADINRAENDSVIKLDQQASASFKKVTFFLQFSLRSLRAIVDAAKEPTIPAEELKAVQSQAQKIAQSGDESVWTDIVLILQDAILRGISQSRMDVDSVFADGEALHVLVLEKIADYTR